MPAPNRGTCRPISPISDDAWMARLESGDVEAALAALQGRYRARVLRFVAARVRDPHLAQDITQEVFAKVFLKSHHYRLGTSFRAWLFQIARNQAATARLAERRSPRPVSALAPDRDGQRGDLLDALRAPPDPRAAEERELMAALRLAVDALPERYRRVFELCGRQGLQYREAAAVLDIPVGTVAIRLMRARQRLYGVMASHLDRPRRPPACVQ